MVAVLNVSPDHKVCVALCFADKARTLAALCHLLLALWQGIHKAMH